MPYWLRTSKMTHQFTSSDAKCSTCFEPLPSALKCVFDNMGETLDHIWILEETWIHWTMVLFSSVWYGPGIWATYAIITFYKIGHISIEIIKTTNMLTASTPITRTGTFVTSKKKQIKLLPALYPLCYRN